MNETLGALEESVLLLVASMKDEAYGFTVVQRYQEHFGQRITISAIHTVLKRLESKGFIESSMGGATAERGGRRKRIFQVSNKGMATLEALHEKKVALWKLIPGIS